MTLKNDIEKSISKWYKRSDKVHTYIKPIEVLPSGIKCWEYDVNGSYFSLFDSRIIGWGDLDKITDLAKSDDDIVELAMKRMAKRLLLQEGE